MIKLDNVSPDVSDIDKVKRALVGIDLRAIPMLLRLPDGIEAKSASYDPSRREIMVALEGDGLPDHFTVLAPDDHVMRTNVWLKSVDAITNEDEPRKVSHIEFQGFNP